MSHASRRRFLGAFIVLALGSAMAISMSLPAKAAACAKVLLIGARGSGQAITDSHGFGPEVYATAQTLLGDASRLGLGPDDIETVAVPDPPYPAINIPLTLMGNAFDLGAFWSNYEASMSSGSAWVARLLVLRAKVDGCPNQKFVLVGYSQGAQLMTDVLNVFADTPSIRGRIAGAVFYGSPLFSPQDSAINAKVTPPSQAYSKSLEGVYRYLRSGEPWTEPSPTNEIGATIPIQSWCLAKDVVCNYSPAWVPLNDPFTKIGPHYQYGKRASDGGAFLAAALKKALSKKNPPPAGVPALSVATASLPQATQAQQYSATISTDGGYAPIKLTLTSDASTFPAGLTFTNGVISGTPTLPGTYAVSVRATDAYGQTADAQYSMTIKPALVGSGHVTLVSTNAAGTAAANGGSGPWWRSMSADGRYIVFNSTATDLLNSPLGAPPADTSVLYRRDTITGQTDVVSVTADGGWPQPGSHSFQGSISDDGRFITFGSDAANLLPGTSPTDGVTRAVYRRDMVTGRTDLVSLGDWPSMSPNGRYITLTGLYVPDPSGNSGIFRKDMDTGDVVRVDRPDLDTSPTVGGSVFTLGVTDSGTVTYMQQMDDGSRDIYRYSGTTANALVDLPVSLSADNLSEYKDGVSSNGTWIAWYDGTVLQRRNTVTGAQASLPVAGRTIFVQVGNDGTVVAGTNQSDALAALGLPGNSQFQTFAWSPSDRFALMSATPQGAPASNGFTLPMALSADGTAAVLEGSSPDLTALPDTNANVDVYKVLLNLPS